VQTALGHRGKLAAQQEMHIETGARQHHTVKPPIAPVPIIPIVGLLPPIMATPLLFGSMPCAPLD
jgi:hypothetical protein